MHESRASHRVSESLAAFGRRWRLIVPFAVVTPLVVFALTAATPATYESSADVLLDRKGQAISGLYDTEDFDVLREIRTQVKLARLPDVRNRVRDAVEREGLDGSDLGQSSVTEDGETDLMTFHVRHADPEIAARVATIYAQQYVAHRRALDSQSLRKAIAVVTAQVARSRELGADPGTYAHLVQQQQQLQSGLVTLAGNVRLARPAVGASRIAPLPLHDSLVALILGLVTGVGLAALANLIDARARTADEISDQLGLPILGRIPLDGRTARVSGSLTTLQREDNLGAEAIRLLRANLELGSLGREHSVVMMTSSVAGEGKSTTVSNLAMALALAGRDVVLVDLDLRRPAISRIFDLQRAPGIVEVARGITELEAAMQVVPLVPDNDRGGSAAPEHSRGTLRVITAGNTLAADTEAVVAGTELPAALAALKQLSDVVLIDTPPILQTGDALTLSPYVDGLIFVAQTRRYRRLYAREIARRLAFSSATPIGLVVIGEPHELEPARWSPYGPRHELNPDVQGFGRA